MKITKKNALEKKGKAFFIVYKRQKTPKGVS
jgi:hypothetical protein